MLTPTPGICITIQNRLKDLIISLDQNGKCLILSIEDDENPQLETNNLKCAYHNQFVENMFSPGTLDYFYNGWHVYTTLKCYSHK